MKILVLSDTHGSLDKAGRIYKKLNGIDLLIHCGDYIKDGRALADAWDVPAICAMGNCDGSRDRQFAIAETPAGNILVTHGHAESVGAGLTRLSYLAQENDCIAACFGHTHIPTIENHGNFWFINPGSLSNPRGASRSSCAIIHAEKDSFRAEILYYDEFCSENDSTPDKGSGDGGSKEKKIPKKATGGFLRNLLNYSDRF